MTQSQKDAYDRKAEWCATFFALFLVVAVLGITTRGFYLWSGPLSPTLDITTRALMFVGSVGILVTFGAGLYYTYRWRQIDAE